MRGWQHRVIDRHHIRTKRGDETSIGQQLIGAPGVDARCKMLPPCAMHGDCVIKTINCKYRKHWSKVIARNKCRVALAVSDAQRTHHAALRRLYYATQTATTLQHGGLHQLHASIGHSGIR